MQYLKSRLANSIGLFAVIALLFVPAAGFAEDGESATESLKIDPGHSNVMFKVNHLGIGYIYGQFTDFSGTIEFNEDEPSDSSIEFTVKTASVETNVDKRDKHLKSPDFLHAKKHPEMTFESTKIEKDGDDYQVTGKLSIRGKTKEVSFEAEHVGSGKGPGGNFRRGFTAEFEIDRTEFGVDWNPEVVKKEMELILAFEAVKTS